MPTNRDFDLAVADLVSRFGNSCRNLDAAPNASPSIPNDSGFSP